MRFLVGEDGRGGAGAWLSSFGVCSVVDMRIELFSGLVVVVMLFLFEMFVVTVALLVVVVVAVAGKTLLFTSP